MNDLFMPSKKLGTKDTLGEGYSSKELIRLSIGIAILVPIALISIFIFDIDYVLVIFISVILIALIFLLVKKTALNVSIFDLILQVISFSKSQKLYLHKRLYDMGYIQNEIIK